MFLRVLQNLPHHRNVRCAEAVATSPPQGQRTSQHLCPPPSPMPPSQSLPSRHSLISSTRLQKPAAWPWPPAPTQRPAATTTNVYLSDTTFNTAVARPPLRAHPAAMRKTNEQRSFVFLFIVHRRGRLPELPSLRLQRRQTSAARLSTWLFLPSTPVP
jgi:hypothetical protein